MRGPWRLLMKRLEMAVVFFAGRHLEIWFYFSVFRVCKKKSVLFFGRVFKHHQAPGVEQIACKAFGKPPKIVPPEIAPHPDWDDFSVSSWCLDESIGKIRKIGNRYIKDQTKTTECQQIYSNIHMDPLSLLCP